MTTTAERLTEFERRELIETAADVARSRIAPHAEALDAADEAAIDACWEEVRALGLDRALAGDDEQPPLPAADVLAMIEELAVADAGFALLVLLHAVAAAAAAGAVPDGGRATVLLAPGGDERAFGFAPGAVGAAAFVLAAPDGARVAAPAAPPHPVPDQMGLRAARAGVVALGDGEGEPAAAIPVRALVLDGLAAIAAGIARRAWALASAYAADRRQGGVPIAEHGAVRALLAEIALARDAGAPALDAGASEAAALARKLRAADAALAAATAAVQVFGGSGYMCETGAERLMRDAMCLRLWPQPPWAARARLVEEASGR